MHIYFIQAGGTIDKDYLPQGDTHGYNFLIDEPAVISILKRVVPKFTYKIKSIIKKDSLDMTDNDRNKILDACKKTKDNKIIITHGTDRFVMTAKVLSDIKNKAIILTGARTPEKFQESDAAFNIGVAVGAIEYLDNGIYICLDGVVQPWESYKV